MEDAGQWGGGETQSSRREIRHSMASMSGEVNALKGCQASDSRHRERSWQQEKWLAAGGIGK